MTSSGHLVRGVFTLGIAQIFGWVGSAALAILMPRYLGDVNLGKLSLALSLTSLLGLVTDFGAMTYLTKEIARDKDRASMLTTNLVFMRVPLSILAMGLTVLIAHVANYDPLTTTIVYILTLGIFITAMSNMVNGTLQGLQHMRVLAVNSMVSKLGYAGMASAFLLVGAGVLYVCFAWVATLAIALLVSAVVLFRNVKLSFHIDVRLWPALFVAGLPFFVWQAALLIYGQIDTVILSFMTTDAVVGWYAAAYRIVMIPVFVPTILVTVIFPALSASASNPQRFNALARRAVQLAAMLTIPMGLGIMLLSDKIIGLLNYPESFNHSIAPLILLAPHLPLAAIDVMIGTVLNTRDKQKLWAFTGIAAAFLNPALNVLFIPVAQNAFGNGAIGAAAITTFTEVFMMVIGLKLMPRGVFNFSTLIDVLKCVGAAAAMAAVVWAVRDLPIVVPVALGGLVYGGACLAVRAVSWSELKQVHMYLLRRQVAVQTTA